MRSGGAPVTSAPRTRMLPEVGRTSPASKPRKVDLPAPFGPMMACTSPAANPSETPSTAASAPNRRESRSVSSTGSATLASEQPGDAAGQKEHHRDDERAQKRGPVRRQPLTVQLE